jgi:hypothetical protein
LALALLACSSEDPLDPTGTGGAATSTTTASGGGAGGAGGSGGNPGGGGSGGGGGGCENLVPASPDAPDLLSQTGLYDDIATRAHSRHVAEFSPSYALWSDGVDKRRFAYLPECDPVIDNTDEDDWVFPVGTRMWKEFSLGGVLLETRLIHRFGPGPNDFLYATYAWRDDDADADRVLSGVSNARGTAHDIPPLEACNNCHGPHPAKGGLPSRYLGFSAIQLSHAGPGVTMQALSTDGHLLVPNPTGCVVPGDAIAQAALGYLHANCGNCHNDSVDGIIFPFMDLRLRASDADVATTATYQTAVNQPSTLFMNGCNHRILGGAPLASCIHVRMEARGSDGMPSGDQMPPLATDVADPTGLAAVDAWITALPPP